MKYLPLSLVFFLLLAAPTLANPDPDEDSSTEEDPPVEEVEDPEEVEIFIQRILRQPVFWSLSPRPTPTRFLPSHLCRSSGAN